MDSKNTDLEHGLPVQQPMLILAKDRGQTGLLQE